MKKVQLLTLVLLLLQTVVFAQSKQMEKGQEFQRNFEYQKAIDAYKPLVEDGNRDAMFAMAKCYDKLEQFNEAASWYEEAYLKNSASSAKDYVAYANVLKRIGDYEKAKKYYEKYAKTNSREGKVLMASCDSALHYMNNPGKEIIENLTINTELKDFSPQFLGAGLVYASEKHLPSETKGINQAWHGFPQQNLYVTKERNGSWLSEPMPVGGKVNTQYHEAVVTFNEEETQVFFTRNNYYSGKKDKSKDGTIHLNIYEAMVDGDQWIDIKEFEHNSDEYSVGHPSLSADGEFLFFISDMPGGLGGTDIYVSKKEGEGWSTPLNLGASINTPLNEMFPFIDDENVLHFSSEGHHSMGGLDMFKSKLQGGGKWGPAQSMGYPMNSPADDFGLIFDVEAQSGYFTSNREGGKGDDDNYYFEAEKEEPKDPKDCDTVTFTAIVLDEETNEPLYNAQIQVLSKEDGTGGIYTTDINGRVPMVVNCNVDYEITARKDDYFTVKSAFKPNGENNEGTFKLNRLVLDKPVLIKNIYYEFDKWNITPEAAAELDNVAYMLFNNPTVQIELMSHTDSRADDNYNMKLSQRRAQAAVDYLVSRGVNRGRMVARGYGESQLVNYCANGVECHEDDHLANRRTEFKVTGFTDGQTAVSVEATDEVLGSSTNYFPETKVPSTDRSGNRGADIKGKKPAPSPNVTNNVTPTYTSNGVVYKIQLGAFGKSTPDFGYLEDLGSWTSYKAGAVMIHTLGDYGTAADARSILNTVHNRGVNDAFVVKFENGQKIKLN